jgi:hypothetical protein
MINVFNGVGFSADLKDRTITADMRAQCGNGLRFRLLAGTGPGALSPLAA